MSLETEISRVVGGAKETLKTLITKMGGTISDEAIDQYPTIAEGITPLDKLDKVAETNKSLPQRFWRGTKKEYDAIETKSDEVMYIVTDDLAPGDTDAMVKHIENADIHVTAEAKAALTAGLRPKWPKASVPVSLLRSCSAKST